MFSVGVSVVSAVGGCVRVVMVVGAWVRVVMVVGVCVRVVSCGVGVVDFGVSVRVDDNVSVDGVDVRVVSVNNR